MTKQLAQLFESTTHIRTERVVELRKDARRAKADGKVAQADRLLERLMRRKCAQVEEVTAATESGARVNLDRLADYIVHHELYDRTPFKIANTEYPFMNERMFDERKAKDTGEPALDNEIARKTRSTRRPRSRYENKFMDERHRAHNNALRDRYNAFKRGEGVAVKRVVVCDAEVPEGFTLVRLDGKGTVE